MTRMHWGLGGVYISTSLPRIQDLSRTEIELMAARSLCLLKNQLKRQGWCTSLCPSCLEEASSAHILPRCNQRSKPHSFMTTNFTQLAEVYTKLFLSAPLYIFQLEHDTIKLWTKICDESTGKAMGRFLMKNQKIWLIFLGHVTYLPAQQSSQK